MCKCERSASPSPFCTDCKPSQKVPHKHAEAIKAWADGETVQFKIPSAGRLDNIWIDLPKGENPMWSLALEYRIKPEPKPDIVRYGWAYTNVHKCGNETGIACEGELFSSKTESNFKMTFDGETGKLKSVEIVK